MALNNEKILLYFIMFFLCSIPYGTTGQRKFVIEQEYLKYLPEGYYNNLEKKWPLLIFLHGAGERGTDIEKIKVHGPPMMIEHGKAFPFIVLSPQAKTSWDEDFLYQMIKDFIAKNRVDTNRIYLTGLSMGGYGTGKLAQKHPNMFAAIAPICGGGNPKDAWKLKHMPIWCFHGKLDQVVPFSASENMVNALKPINPNVKFTVYLGIYHDSWKPAYKKPELYEWFLKQEKYKHKAVEVSVKMLEQYVGKYDFDMNGFNGICDVFIENDKLNIKIGQRNTVLIPSSDNTFFINENQPVGFKFIKNKRGVVDKILLCGDELITIPKIVN